MTGYAFQRYDVLQIERPNAQTQVGEWLDFSTLRTELEGQQAVALVRSSRWEGRPATFRIVRYVIGRGYVTQLPCFDGPKCPDCGAELSATGECLEVVRQNALADASNPDA